MTAMTFGKLFAELMAARLYFNIGTDVAQVWYDALKDMPDEGVMAAMNHYRDSPEPRINLGMVKDYARGQIKPREALPEYTQLTPEQIAYNKKQFQKLNDKLAGRKGRV